MARWQYRKKKAAREQREKEAREWLIENPGIAKRLAAHIGWKTFFLEVEDEFDVGLPDAVKKWVKWSAGD